ncbi:MAG: tetratricopeptide repeat protein, partial [Candidatus Competibacteraceae bacterium]|nr:tetratricopeptide repeat protein [Candidatus Competibacteraceae bacterium]
MRHYGYWLIAGLLCWGVIAYAQEQKSEDYVGAVTAHLQEETGKTPQSQEIVDALNRVVAGLYQEGDYRTAVTVAEQTYRFAEQKLGPEHPNTLTSVNDLAFLYQAQGRY